MGTKKIKTIELLATCILLLGAVGWFLPFSGWPHRPYTEGPNSEPHGIVLDSSGNIYCGSKAYGRIQKYHPDGKFAYGINSEGGTGWGSGFGFRINEKDQLCVTVSRVLKDNKGSVHRTRTYDGEGELINSEERRSDERHYTHSMGDYETDSAGNRYSFKGFLFPRVEKRARRGEGKVIIRTPIWLWFLQAPFPAFGFAFVSMFVLIFLRFKAEASKRSISTSECMFDGRELPSRRRIIMLASIIIGIVVVLCIVVPIGIEKYPFLVIFGFVGFWITIVLSMLLSFICLALAQLCYMRIDFRMWKGSIFGSSLESRCEARAFLRSLESPAIQIMGKLSKRIVPVFLLVWFIIMMLVIGTVLYLDHIGVWHDLAGNGIVPETWTHINR